MTKQSKVEADGNVIDLYAFGHKPNYWLNFDLMVALEQQSGDHQSYYGHHPPKVCRKMSFNPDK